MTAHVAARAAPRDRRDLVEGAAAVVLAAAVTALLGITGTGGPDPAVPWPVLAIAALVALSLPVRTAVGRVTITHTPIDAVVAAGLLLSRPDELVLAVGAAAAVRLVVVERARAGTLLVELALSAVRLTGAIGAWQVVRESPLVDGIGPAAAVALAALAGGAAAAGVAAALGLVLAGGRHVGEAIGSAVRGGGLVLAAVSLGAIVSQGLHDGDASWWLGGLPLVLLVVVTVQLSRQQDRSDGLAGAIESTRRINAATGPQEALQHLLDELQLRFDADGAEFIRLPADGGPPTRVARGDETDWSLFGPGGREGVAELHPSTLRRTPRRGRGISLRSSVGDGAVVLRVRRGPLRTPYRRGDLERFQAVCDAAVQSLEASRLSDMLRRLEQLDEMKTAFLTAVSHDLRTPLAVLLAGVGTLEMHGDRLAPEQTAVLLDRMTAQGRRLDRMLGDLLDIDRLERGVIEPRREAVDLGELVGAVVEEIGRDTHVVHLPTGSVPAWVDPGHVGRIIENLVRNAIKYTPHGTEVWVDARRDAVGAQLIVSDAGPGVPEAQRREIFDPFVRGDDAHPSPGTGVGLDLVRRLAELHGGTAWVDERPGGGARFWVTLPDPEAVHAVSAG